jgi:hypothetical protein
MESCDLLDMQPYSCYGSTYFQGKFRPSKFEMRPEEGTVLEGELSSLLSPTLKGLMFNKSGDFKKYCEAASALTEALPTIFNEVCGSSNKEMGGVRGCIEG